MSTLVFPPGYAEGQRYLSDAELQARPYPPAATYNPQSPGVVANGADIARWHQLHPQGPPAPTGTVVLPPPPALPPLALPPVATPPVGLPPVLLAPPLAVPPAA